MMDPLHFSSRRSPIYATNGCVATSQPLATSIGLHILRSGGNAADATIAIAAALAVCEPCSTGLGGDAFGLWFDAKSRRVEGLNGSGRSPAALDLSVVEKCYDGLSKEQMREQFSMGVHSVTVPGAAQAWEDVHSRYGSGRFTLLELLEPAIQLAENGFPVAPITAVRWRDQMNSITKWYTGDEVQNGQVELSVDAKGTAPTPGHIFRNPHLANVLRSLGAQGAQNGFYSAFPGKAIVEAIQKHGGVMTMEDMKNHNSSTYPSPISVEYHGYKLWEIPPNGQGIAGLIALEGLKALEECGLVESSSLKNDKRHPQCSAELLHAQIETMRLGFADARAKVCDPDFVGNDNNVVTTSSTEWLLDKDRIANRASKLFNKDKAVVQGVPDPSSCTVSFQVVDREGNAMSFVNSNYMGFGTGLTPSNCGFTLQNRGAGFSLDPTHPNALAPSKRPYHTIIPAMMTHADTGELYATVSNMGGYMQPQGHMQLVSGLVRGLDPQTAIDAPRFCISDGTHNGLVYLEDGFHSDTVSRLEKIGHKMKRSVKSHEREVFGRAQIITRDRKTGVLCAGSDGRADGCALGY